MGYKDEFNNLVVNKQYEEARILLEKNKSFAYDDSFYFANMGWVLNHIERYQEAISYLQKGIHQFPDDAWMYTQLGYSYNHLNQAKEALPFLLKGLECGHDEPWVHSEIGWAYRQIGDYEHAIEYLENALLDDSDNVWINAQAAFAYRDHGNLERAEEYLKKVCKISPDADSYYDLINFYAQNKRFEEELEVLDLIEDPKFELWKNFEKAYAYNRLERYQDAIPLLEKCLEDGRDDTGLREELGDAYRGINNQENANVHYAKAIKYYEKALARNGDDAKWILQDMIWISQKQENMIDKLQYLDRLSAIEPENAWSTYHYARTYANLKDYDKAMEYIDKNITFEGESIENLSYKAWILGKQDKIEEALELLKTVESMGRKDGWLYCEMGWNHSELEQYEQAIVCYEKAYAMDNQDAWMISQIAWNKSALKQHKEALPYFFEAEQKGRVDGWLYANIGFNYLQLKQFEDAIPYFEKAKSLGYKEDWFKNRMKELKKELKQVKK